MTKENLPKGLVSLPARTLLSLALMGFLLFFGCDSEADPLGLGPPLGCIETAEGWIQPERFFPCEDPTELVIRTQAEYQAAFGCPAPPEAERPPAPGPGEMLIVDQIMASGCDACVEIDCVDLRETEVVVKSRAGASGACLWIVSSPGTWVIAPDLGRPLRFEEKAPMPFSDQSVCR